MRGALHVGFTGTRRGMTPAQLETVAQLLLDIKLGAGGRELFFHQGLCVGADEQAAQLAQAAGYRIIGHPPTNRSLISRPAALLCERHRPARPYLDRNHDIVMEAEVVLATPAEDREVLRSGTWATIRHARKEGVSLLLVVPDGRVL